MRPLYPLKRVLVFTKERIGFGFRSAERNYNMFPYLDHDGHLPMYGILMVLGIGVSGLVLLLLKMHPEISKWDRVYGAGLTLVSALIGAKVFSILTSIDIIIKYNLSFTDIIKNGFVFYGGLIGGVACLTVYCVAYKISLLKFLDLAAVALPVGHAVGRIGCFCAGCCFGKPFDSIFSVIYTAPADPNTPTSVPLLPTQLFEAGYCLIIFAVLFIMSQKKHADGLFCVTYIFAYSVCRFINEFFRYDAARGFLWIFSTSQFISLLLILTTAGIIALRRKRRRQS